MASIRIVPAGSEEDIRLRAQGWVVAHRSFGAQLDAERADLAGLRRLVNRAGAFGSVRALGPADVTAILALDRATTADYPGGAATQHTPLTEATAEVGVARRAFGLETSSGQLVAMTFVDVEASAESAETDFTVVDREWRARGVATAVKAASVLALMDAGIRTFRTGGSRENAAILATNAALGYRIDEEWVTLTALAC